MVALIAGAAPAGAADPERGHLTAGAKRLARVPGDVRAARTELRERLGRQGLLSVDPATGGVRFLARLDGFLTRPQARDAAVVAREYIRERAEVLGLDPGDVRSLRLSERGRSGRLERIEFTQSVEEVPLVDSRLRAHVSPDGRLLALTGGLRPDPELETTRPQVSRREALGTAAEDVAPRGAAYKASLVAYERGAELRLGWRVLVAASSTAHYDTIVDAQTGAVERRVNRVKFGTAPVFDNYPGAAVGGTAAQQELQLSDPARLFGPNAHAFVDHNDVVPGPDFDTFAPPPGEETPPDAAGNFDHPFDEFVPSPPDDYGCEPAFRCSWDPKVPFDWVSDANQAATQLFWFVNTFHDHLEDAPGIEFGDGNFEGADRVIAQAQDGADGTQTTGFPDPDHANNANMLVLPDGSPGLMQMYLWDPVVEDGVRPVHGGDDPTLVYHEYAHGLTNRLLTDAQHYGALNGAQAGAIDEGSADWYALDYLVDGGLEPDGPEPDLTVGGYVTTSPTGVRTQPIDCLLTSHPDLCPDAGIPGGAGERGYTYGHLGLINGGPEVHDDGEIWAQTLWQLRERLIQDHPADGVMRARRLVTNGLRLAPQNPSFLDMRNAILLVDTQAGGEDRAAIWEVFASRGMGYAASTLGTDDVQPIEDFSKPPQAGEPTGSVAGTVRDGDTGAPLPNALVGFAGHDSGLGEDLADRTGSDGSYRIENVPARTWDHASVAPGAGYDRELTEDVAVGVGENTLDFAPRRNWALASGGAQIASFTGPDFTSAGCGPAGLIDATRLGVWGTEAPGPKEIVVRLPDPVTVDEVWIDPTAGCGDPANAALSAYQVQTSADGASFSTIGAGTFGPGHAGKANAVPLTAQPAGVRFVKLRALTNQGNLDFMDVAELRVLGHQPGPQVPPAIAEAAAGPSPAPTGAKSIPRLRFLTRRARLTRGGAFVWKLAGPAHAAAAASFTAAVPQASARRRRTLARRRFRIGASGRARVFIHLPRRTRRRLRRVRSLHVTVSVRVAGVRATSRFVLRTR